MFVFFVFYARYSLYLSQIFIIFVAESCHNRCRRPVQNIVKPIKPQRMILTTTPVIEGHPILEYKQVVTAEAIIGANVFKDFFANLRDTFGGRVKSYEKVLREGKQTAMTELMEAAKAVGANAIVGLDIDYETVGARGSMLMVVVSGTAVVI